MGLELLASTRCYDSSNGQPGEVEILICVKCNHDGSETSLGLIPMRVIPEF